MRLSLINRNYTPYDESNNENSRYLRDSSGFYGSCTDLESAGRS